MDNSSSMSDPMKKHLANMQYLQQQQHQKQQQSRIMDDNEVIEVDNETHNLIRNAEETDDEYNKRLRKINLLSLAQEFAALKQVEADGLSFEEGRKSQQDYSPMSEVSTETESEEEECDGDKRDEEDKEKIEQTSRSKEDNKTVHKSNDGPIDVSHDQPADQSGDFDVYNADSTDVMDWNQLEQQLQKAAEEQKERQSRRNDREEIRRRLAMGVPGDESDLYPGDRSTSMIRQKPTLQTRLQGGLNLQVCFINDVPPVDDQNDQTPNVTSTSQPKTDRTQPSTHSSTQNSSTSNKKEKNASTGSNKAPPGGSKENQDDFFSRQERLQKEAQMALAQVRPMAHMQLQVEKQQKKKSPIAEIVGLPTRKMHTKQDLLDMNIAQLQVLVNDMHTQIENLNEELMRMLLKRDELHMEQDSMLVDIEDQTRRAQECARQSASVKSVPRLS